MLEEGYELAYRWAVEGWGVPPDYANEFLFAFYLVMIMIGTFIISALVNMTRTEREIGTPEIVKLETCKIYRVCPRCENDITKVQAIPNENKTVCCSNCKNPLPFTYR